MGIRLKMFCCLSLALLPLVAMWGHSNHLLERHLHDTTRSALINAHRLESARITKILGEFTAHAENLAAGAHVREFTSAVNRHRQSVNNQNTKPPAMAVIGGYDGFSIVNPEADWPLQELALKLQRKAGMMESSLVQVRLVDRQGVILGESIGFSWSPTDTTLVEQSMGSARTLIGDAFRNDEGKDKLGIVAPIFSDLGEVTGALLIERRLRPIIHLIAEHEGTGYSSEAHLAQPTPSGDAQFITPLRFDRSAAFSKVVSNERFMPVTRSLASPDLQVIRDQDYRSVDSFLAIQTIPETGWGLVVKVDAEEALAPAIELRNSVVFVALVAILVTLLIYGFSFWPIARRLRETAEAARQISNGDLRARITDQHDDEISEMARSINRLAHDLTQDQKKRTEVEARLRYQAMHDELTGLLNRKHANRVLKNLQTDPGCCHSIMFIDLNGFKEVNDRFGHAIGDSVLQVVADRLAARVPDGATLARWGGDEFVVILPETSQAEATELLHRFHESFRKPVTTTAGTHQISCSIGLSTSDNGQAVEQTLTEADSLMYRQKSKQRIKTGRLPEPGNASEQTKLRSRFELWCQPVVRAGSNGKLNLLGVDTQLRALTDSMISPDVEAGMVSSEEQELLLAPVDRHFKESLQALKRWRLADIVSAGFRIRIPLTAATLAHEELCRLIEARLSESAVPAESLIIEIPLLNQPDERERLPRLRASGALLAIACQRSTPALVDALSQYKPDMVVLDSKRPTDLSNLAPLVRTCRDLDIDLVADRIDNREWVQRLRQHGIEQFQGDLFAPWLRPVDFISRWGQAHSKRAMGGTPLSAVI